MFDPYCYHRAQLIDENPFVAKSLIALSVARFLSSLTLTPIYYPTVAKRPVLEME
jgi:hypothetical protein